MKRSETTLTESTTRLRSIGSRHERINLEAMRKISSPRSGSRTELASRQLAEGDGYWPHWEAVGDERDPNADGGLGRCERGQMITSSSCIRFNPGP